MGRSNWPLASPSRKARETSVPPRRERRNRTSLWPSKIGTGRGDVIKDVPFKNVQDAAISGRRLGVIVHQRRTASSWNRWWPSHLQLQIIFTRPTRRAAGSNRCHLPSDEPKADQH